MGKPDWRGRFPVKDGIPWRSGVYGLGSMASTAMTTTVVTWLLFYASGSADPAQPAGGHGYFGIAMALGRVVDAVADPIIGRWSDRTRTRLGRRVPFLLIGAVPMGITFAALWVPYTGAPIPVLAARMGLLLSAFFMLFTFVVCPYLAMLPEITADNRGRLRLASWQAMGSIVGGGVIGLLSAKLFDAVGFQAGGLLIGLAAAAVFVAIGLCFVGTRSAGAVPPRPVKVDGMVGPLREALGLVTQQRSLRFYLTGLAGLWIGLNMMTISLPYVVTCVLDMPTTAVGKLALAHMAGTLVMLPFVSEVARAHGKIPSLRTSVIALGGVVPLLALGPPATWLAAVVAGPLLALVYALPNAVLAEITDDRRRKTGDGQEALHFGAQGLVLKGALAVAAWLTGMLFGLFGATPERLVGLRLATSLGGLFCILGGLALGAAGRETAS